VAGPRFPVRVVDFLTLLLVAYFTPNLPDIKAVPQ
jgi:hypothetical protein